jgi:hypothetical protein
MNIIVEPIPPSRYKGTLFVDGKEIETSIQSRPGCCVRTLMNRLILLKGKPKNTIDVKIEGW